MLYNKTHINHEPESVAESVARLIVSKVKKKEGTLEHFNLAISGGNTPNILFRMLADEYAGQIDWNTLRIFWVDERCVDPADKESNYGNVHKILLENVPLPPENIFNIRGDNNPSDEVVRYRQVLKKELPEKNGFPVFDMILLGMGDDGHTASIFPDNLELIHSAQTVEAALHPHSGQYRITLTGNVICNAKQVIFLITGNSKAEIIESILNEKGDFERFPAYYILSGCEAELYLDFEAAERL